MDPIRHGEFQIFSFFLVLGKFLVLKLRYGQTNTYTANYVSVKGARGGYHKNLARNNQTIYHHYQSAYVKAMRRNIKIKMIFSTKILYL